MLSENQINLLPERITQRLSDINTEYLENIGSVLYEIGELRPKDVHQLQRMYKHGADIDKVIEKLSRESVKNVAEIYEIFDIVAKENYNYAEPFYKAKKKAFIPYEENEELKGYVKSLAKQTVDEYVNLTQHTAFAVFDKGGKSIAPLFAKNKDKLATSLSDTYTKIIDYAVTKVQLGTDSYTSAMSEVIKAMASSGIKTVDYATGYSRRLDTAVRQNILWGIKQCNQNTADRIGEEFGADGYEISYHSNPRPSHAEMGGQQYVIGKARVVNGVRYQSFSDVEGLLEDYGCLHFKFPILLGISQPAYSKAQLEEFKTEDNKTFEFEGKKYTKYEASQMQRKLETAIRHERDLMKTAKEFGNDELINEAREKINLLTSKYAELSKAGGLSTKMERTRLGMKNVDISTKSSIMEVAAKSAERNTGALLKYNPKASFEIYVSQYSNKVNAELSKATAEVAKLGGQTGKEHLILVDLLSGEHKYTEASEDAMSVGGTKFWKFVKEHSNEKFAFVHNHNTDGYLSETDMRTLLTTHNIEMFVAVRIDGISYVVQKNGKYKGNGNFDELYKDDLKIINELLKEGKITAGERTHQREELIVDSLIRDYTEGLEEFENGKRMGKRND